VVHGRRPPNWIFAGIVFGSFRAFAEPILYMPTKFRENILIGGRDMLLKNEIRNTAGSYISKYRRYRYYWYYTGRSPGHAVGMAGCGHSKIARVARAVFVFVLYVVGRAY